MITREAGERKINNPRKYSGVGAVSANQASRRRARTLVEKSIAERHKSTLNTAPAGAFSTMASGSETRRRTKTAPLLQEGCFLTPRHVYSTWACLLGPSRSFECLHRLYQTTTHLDDVHGREVSRGLQAFGVAVAVEAVAHNAEDLVFARRPRAAEILETGDELGDLTRP